MIVSKTPMRMSFVGGGSDLKSFYQDEVGAVLSTSIDKYMYIVVNKKFDGNIRLSYSKTEDTTSVDDIQHPLVREALKVSEIQGGIEIASLADIPSQGSGLGSSSAYTVGLLNALYAFKNQYIPRSELAKLACEIEIQKCGEPIGKQDQYASAYGGLNLIRFHPDETVSVDPVICSSETFKAIENSIIVFYTGRTRTASGVLKEQAASLLQNDTKKIVRRMVNLAFDLKAEIELGHVENIGSILDENWKLKVQLASGITDDQINQWYLTGLKSGAKGGKLLGAGNGGFIMFFAPPETHNKIAKQLHFLKRVNFGFESSGSQIVFYQPTL